VPFEDEDGEKAATADDYGILVFDGPLEEATFLVSLLESGGITARLVTAIRPRSVLMGHALIFVLSSEADDARACVEDFKRNGKRTTG